MLSSVQSLNLSDRVTLSATDVSRLGFQYDAFIEGMKHEISKSSNHRVTYILSPSTASSGADSIILDSGPGLDTGTLAR